MINLLLIGAGGYGNLYSDELYRNRACGRFRVCGIVDPYFDPACRLNKEWRALGVPVYSQLKDFYEGNRCDLAIISSPVFLHYEQALTALKHHSNVLCEKPVTMSKQQLKQIAALAKQKKLLFSAGFQMPFSTAVKRLKEDIASGVWGKPLRMKTLMLYGRFSNASWYHKKFAPNGQPLFDSIAGNPGAHYIFHMFYCAGSPAAPTCMPVRVVARTAVVEETTETYDVVSARAFDQNGTEYLYYGGTPVSDADRTGPIFDFLYENGIVSYRDGCMKGNFNNGTQVSYGDPFEQETTKLWDALDRVEAGCVESLFDLEDTTSHLLFVEGIHRSVPDAKQVMSKDIEICNGRKTVKGIKQQFLTAYHANRLLDCDWLATGNDIVL